MKPALPPALQAFWQARDARERRALKLLAELHHDLGLVVRQAQVTAASSGLANIDAELQLARSSQ